MLTLLKGRELYGLEIYRGIEERSEGIQVLRVGQLYPLLHSLERKQLVTSWMSIAGQESRGGNRRKYYKLTEQGLVALEIATALRESLMSRSWYDALSPA